MPRPFPSARSPWFPTAGLLAAVLAGATAPPARADGEPDVRRTRIVVAVERARPAVVAIHTTELRTRSAWGIEFPDLPPERREGLGSGVIFHPDGYVATNAHVVARATQILVDLMRKDAATGAEKTVQLKAHVLAFDVPDDLAVLKLEPAADQGIHFPLPYLSLGRSNDLMLGETVIAVGNPYGLGYTVTTGVLSGIGRRLPVRGQQAAPEDFLQIDAAINQGNSGGPLMDVTGRWIGVTSTILDRRLTGAEGIGFAIPADRVRSLILYAMKRRLVTEEWIGIEEDEGKSGEPVVRFVFPKGPAVGADVRPNDVIAAVNGTPTRTLYDYRMATASLPMRARVSLSIVRDGVPRAAPVVIALEPVPTARLSDKHFGLEALSIDEEINRQTQIPFESGVLVSRIRPGGPASKIGLRAGDLVVGLGTKVIRNADDLLIFLQPVQPGDLVQIKVRRLTEEYEGMRGEDKTGALVAE